MTWRYIVQRIAGPSKGRFLDFNLPLGNVEITNAIGPGWLSGAVSPRVLLRRAEDGRPLLDKWSTAIWAEEGGRIRGGGILVTNFVEGPVRQVECMGYLGYLNGIPFMGQYSGVQVDPMDVYRMLWNHVQSYPAGDLDVIVSNTKSPVRIGTATDEGDDDGPYRLNWWEAPDCGDTAAWLAGYTPFEARERHQWNSDKTQILHYVDLGHPRIGRRRTDLRFVLGENIKYEPKITVDGEEFANEAVVLGAGEGRKMVRGHSAIRDNRLRRVAVVSQKNLKSKSRLNDIARSEVNFLNRDFELNSITVVDHPNARLNSWSPGDEILVQGRSGDISVKVWCRVLESTMKPDLANEATLTLERV